MSSERIIICTECNGEGLEHFEELTDYHNRHYNYWTEKCSECKGSGRLFETTKVSRKPYKQKKVEKK